MKKVKHHEAIIEQLQEMCGDKWENGKSLNGGEFFKINESYKIATFTLQRVRLLEQ